MTIIEKKEVYDNTRPGTVSPEQRDADIQKCFDSIKAGTPDFIVVVAQRNTGGGNYTIDIGMSGSASPVTVFNMLNEAFPLLMEQIITKHAEMEKGGHNTH